MFNTGNIVRGDELFVYITNQMEPIMGYSTSCTLTRSLSTIEIAAKEAGRFINQIGNKSSWEITCEGLYCNASAKTLYNLLANCTKTRVIFGYADVTDEQKKYGFDFHTYDAGKLYLIGYAYITSLSVSASSGDFSTISVTLTGTGELILSNPDPVVTTTIAPTTGTPNEDENQ